MYLQAAAIVSNLAAIATSDSPVRNGQRPSWGKRLWLEVRDRKTERENKRMKEKHVIRARTNGPEDRVSPVWVETDSSEGIMKGHHPNSFFAPIWCSWAHHLSLTMQLFFLSLHNYTQTQTLFSLLLLLSIVFETPLVQCFA